VLRQFMRQYVAEHGDGAESPLPGTKTPTTAKGSKS
jgi:hypothetical protein